MIQLDGDRMGIEYVLIMFYEYTWTRLETDSKEIRIKKRKAYLIELAICITLGFERMVFRKSGLKILIEKVTNGNLFWGITFDNPLAHAVILGVI